MSKSFYQSIKDLKTRVVVLFQSIGYSLKSLRYTFKGQFPKYEILQLSHRLEKGLLVEDPKPFWGWEKANRIAALLSINSDDFSNRTARGVLKAYIDAKKKSDNSSEKEMALRFENDNPSISNEDT